MFRLDYDFSQIAFLETNSVFSHLSWVFTHCLIWCKRSFWKTPYFRLSHSMITIVCNFRNNGGNGLTYNEIVLPAAKLDWKREISLGGGSHHQYLRYHCDQCQYCAELHKQEWCHTLFLKLFWDHCGDQKIFSLKYECLFNYNFSFCMGLVIV